MAHNLNYNEKTQKHSFFSVKEKAWHGLGQIITDYPTSAEAIKHAGLDYIVAKRSLITFSEYIDQQGLPSSIPDIEVDNFYENVRTDTNEVLGVVGKDYNIVKNVDAFAFFDGIVGRNDGILYEKQGLLARENVFL